MTGMHHSTAAMLFADARLPSGGHAFSSGVEPALMAGVGAEQIPVVIAERARTTTLVEAGTAVVSAHRRRVGGDIDEVETAWAARTPSAAQREASRAAARGYLRVGGRLFPDDPILHAWSARTIPPPRASVVGVMACGCDMPAAELARLVVYEDVHAAAAAALKLEPQDPLVLVDLVAGVCAALDDEVVAVSTITEPRDIPAHSAPLAEMWAEAHARSNRRLFRA